MVQHSLNFLLIRKNESVKLYIGGPPGSSHGTAMLRLPTVIGIELIKHEKQHFTNQSRGKVQTNTI